MILIDYREPSVMENWFQQQDIDIELKRTNLSIGDYLIKTDKKEVPCERKTTDDYVSSLYSGQLKSHLFQLSKEYPESFLLIVGDFYELLFRGAISRYTLISSKVSVVIKRAGFGVSGWINIIPLESDYDIPYCLYRIHKMIEKSDFACQLSPTIKKENEKAILTAMYQCLPGVGIEKAQKLAEQFPSLRALSSASISELKEVEGIGDKFARKIYKVLEGV